MNSLPVQSCQKDGKSGKKYGKSGKCYIGPDAEAKAAKQGKAIEISKGKAQGKSWAKKLGKGKK